MASHKTQYRSVIGKKRWMESRGKVSVPDEPGSKVAIIAPFISELIQNPGDTFDQFENQVAAYEAYYQGIGREPVTLLGATLQDVKDVITDPSIPSMVVTGWGNMSSVAAPFAKDRGLDARYGYLDWLHFSDVATHVKQGHYVMLHCGGLRNEFNPPVALGIMQSHANILGLPGLPHYASQSLEGELFPPAITSDKELTYSAIKELFPLKRDRNIPVIPDSMVPDGLYKVARNLYNNHLNTGMPDIPPPEPLPRPNLVEFKQFYEEVA